jgi:tRNA pseudouridine38-40 synthase
MYDGTTYKGFQIQVGVPTIQGELEAVLKRLTGAVVRVLTAGRTDAGVHAQGQVIAFDVDWRHSLADLQRGMNALLSEQIAVLELVEVPEDFHPRYAALSRRYRYTIYRSPIRNPLVCRYSLHINRPLRFEMMQDAASRLVGEHDFAAFGSPPEGNNTVREVFEASWREAEDWLTFDVEANAFLYRMVRMLVGTMLRVGAGTLTLEKFNDLVRGEEHRGGPAIAAKGLCLMAVRYEDGQHVWSNGHNARRQIAARKFASA